MREPDDHDHDHEHDDHDHDDEAGVVEMPIEEELDLHTFAPRDVNEVVLAYLEAAVERGFAEVRIVHGKGQGTLRRIVHAALEGHPDVESFRLGDERSGSWGATLVRLRRKPA